ncbi:MAG: haloacid dehalogenase [Candidatus Poribacteria bacterium]|nr:MAG: haloacid dehalogenase [Candidatus Poribacteria bacterium]
MTPSLRLLGLDIDGTLLDPTGRLRERVREQLVRFHRAGGTIVLVTGRRFESAVRYGCQLPVPALIGAHNGAVLREVSGAVLDVQPMEERSVAQTVAAARSLGAVAWVYQHNPSGPTWIYADPPERVPISLREFAHRYLEMTRAVVRWLSQADDPPTANVLEVMVSVREEEAARVEEGLRTQLGGTVRLIPERSGGRVHFGVVHHDVSKARPLQFLCRAWGIDRTEVLAMGDNLNDVEMLEFAGHAYAMANGHPLLLARGYPQAPSNAEDGVAVVLERYLRQGG